LLPVATRLLHKHKEEMTNPLFLDEWVIFVQPLAESSSINIFSLFSTSSQKQALETEKQLVKTVYLLIIIFAAYIFYHFYSVTKTTGLSIRRKMAALFFLCMQLPISILVFLGLSYSLSQERLLSRDADTQLIELVKRVDNGALDFYRTTNEWLKSIKDLPELKQLNLAALRKIFFDYSRSNQLQSYYLVGLDGEIVFDIDNLGTAEGSNRIFIKELGMRILSADSGGESYHVQTDSALAEGLFDLITRKTGNMHLVNWPGTNRKNLIFSDIIYTADGRKLEAIAAIDKTELDRNYLRQAVTNQFKISPEREIIVLREDDIADTIPRFRNLQGKSPADDNDNQAVEYH
jgi:hypothetical protein